MLTKVSGISQLRKIAEKKQASVRIDCGLLPAQPARIWLNEPRKCFWMLTIPHQSRSASSASRSMADLRWIRFALGSESDSSMLSNCEEYALNLSGSVPVFFRIIRRRLMTVPLEQWQRLATCSEERPSMQ